MWAAILWTESETLDDQLSELDIKLVFRYIDADSSGEIHLSELLEFIDGNDLSDRSCPAHADADLEAIWHELGGAGDVEDHGGGHHCSLSRFERRSLRISLYRAMSAVFAACRRSTSALSSATAASRATAVSRAKRPGRAQGLPASAAAAAPRAGDSLSPGVWWA